mmetsp:Transcript_48176/g.94113  ORF Transcript_48176/g.94113 Transcript_48176/m.94113 type:complete len:668 (-) Transcript_48176:2445-4448(-)
MLDNLSDVVAAAQDHIVERLTRHVLQPTVVREFLHAHQDRLEHPVGLAVRFLLVVDGQHPNCLPPHLLHQDVVVVLLHPRHDHVQRLRLQDGLLHGRVALGEVVEQPETLGLHARVLDVLDQRLHDRLDALFQRNVQLVEQVVLRDRPEEGAPVFLDRRRRLVRLHRDQGEFDSSQRREQFPIALFLVQPVPETGEAVFLNGSNLWIVMCRLGDQSDPVHLQDRLHVQIVLLRDMSQGGRALNLYSGILHMKFHAVDNTFDHIGAACRILIGAVVERQRGDGFIAPLVHHFGGVRVHRGRDTFERPALRDRVLTLPVLVREGGQEGTALALHAGTVVVVFGGDGLEHHFDQFAQHLFLQRISRARRENREDFRQRGKDTFHHLGVVLMELQDTEQQVDPVVGEHQLTVVQTAADHPLQHQTAVVLHAETFEHFHGGDHLRQSFEGHERIPVDTVFRQDRQHVQGDGLQRRFDFERLDHVDNVDDRRPDFGFVGRTQDREGFEEGQRPDLHIDVVLVHGDRGDHHVEDVAGLADHTVVFVLVEQTRQRQKGLRLEVRARDVRLEGEQERVDTEFVGDLFLRVVGVFGQQLEGFARLHLHVDVVDELRHDGDHGADALAGRHEGLEFVAREGLDFPEGLEDQVVIFHKIAEDVHQLVHFDIFAGFLEVP